jgi:hypothetical protein
MINPMGSLLTVPLLSPAYDETQQLLYVSISQIFTYFFLPFYRPRVALVTILHLEHDADGRKFIIDSQQDLYQTHELVKFFWPGGAALLWLCQWLTTLVCVLNALVFAPVTWLEQRVAEKRKVL